MGIGVGAVVGVGVQVVAGGVGLGRAAPEHGAQSYSLVVPSTKPAMQ